MELLLRGKTGGSPLSLSALLLVGELCGATRSSPGSGFCDLRLLNASVVTEVLSLAPKRRLASFDSAAQVWFRKYGLVN